MPILPFSAMRAGLRDVKTHGRTNDPTLTLWLVSQGLAEQIDPEHGYILTPLGRELLAECDSIERAADVLLAFNYSPIRSRFRVH